MSARQRLRDRERFLYEEAEKPSDVLGGQGELR